MVLQVGNWSGVSVRCSVMARIPLLTQAQAVAAFVAGIAAIVVGVACFQYVDRQVGVGVVFGGACLIFWSTFRRPQ